MLTRTSMLAAICAAAVISLAPGQERVEAPQRVALPKPGKGAEIIFVGNSLTRFHDLPAMVRALGRNDRPARKLTTVMVAPGGYTLRQHLEFPHELRPAAEIQKRKATYVVLQEQSARPLEAPTLMEHAACRFAELCRQNCSVPVWYMTFARQHQPHLQDKISTQYEKIHRDHGGLLAPVGRAWQLLRHEQPQMDLHMQDRVHPSKKGAYLTACVLYGTMFGADVKAFPNKLVSVDAHGHQKVLIDLDPKEGRLLRAAAAQVLEKRKKAAATARKRKPSQR